MFAHTYYTHIKDREPIISKTVDDIIGASVVSVLGLASTPLWLPALAAKGATIISSHGAGLTAGALVTGVKALAEGKAPKEAVKDIVKGLAVGAAVEVPLENWLSEMQQNIKK